MAQQQEVGRYILPIPDQPYEGLIKFDAMDSEMKFPKTEELRPPQEDTGGTREVIRRIRRVSGPDIDCAINQS